MSQERVSFGNCIILALVLAEVTAWTIDLPEVRKYIFEKNAKQQKYEDYNIKNEEVGIYYNNINDNSKHNTKNYADVYENNAYAREYGYQSYMEKKVHGIVYKGSVYLEGLRRSLENYTLFLEGCERNNYQNGSFQSNSTTWRPAVGSSSNFSSLNSSSFNPSSLNSSSLNSSSLNPSSFTSSSLNSLTQRDSNSTNSERDLFNITNLRETNSSNSERCKEATRVSEHVRRLSELAMWVTRELQDIAYARKYKKGEYHEIRKEENELILKLAWFLDRLAHHTGYEPAPRDSLDTGEAPRSTSTTPAPFSLVSVPPEVTRELMECLKRNSSIPADIRCQYPDPLPDLVQMMMSMNSNISGIPTIPASSSSNQNDQVLPLPSESRSESASDQSMELLIASDYRTPALSLSPFLNFAPLLTDVRNVRKRSVLSMFKPEVSYAPKVKRSTVDDPTINFLKYYAKHKVWEGSNSKNIDTKTKFEEYEVKNHLPTHNIQKRAIEKKSKHLKMPENPFQDLSKYIKHKPGVNYVTDATQVEKIRAALDKLRNSKPDSSKFLLRKLTKMFREKRSIKFENDVDLPRKSVNPQKDISYYTKNKPGRNYNNDLVQAVQVRAGLEEVFNTGNIEVVRRFGTNYNPLIPAPFYAGIYASQADFKK